MVLEKLYETDYLRRNKYAIFLISLTCTILGMGWSLISFGNNHSFVTLSFTSLMILFLLKDIIAPKTTFNKDLRIDMKSALSEYKEGLTIFIPIFLGVFLPFIFYSALLSENAINYFFTGQYELVSTTSVRDIYSNLDLRVLFSNNLLVFMGCLISAFFFGLGAIFLFITIWNASVFGVVFGVVISHTSSQFNTPILAVFLVVLTAVIPHTLLEMCAYFIAGVTGERLSDLLFFKKRIKKFFFEELTVSSVFIFVGLLTLIIAAFLEVNYAPSILSLFK